MKINLYTPYLQGFYIGELVNQIRQLCFIKNNDLSIIRTNNFGVFDSEIDLDCDAIIIIRNAVSPSFIKRIEQLQIPRVSIGYDYFPADVPLISVDNAKGVAIAIDHLIKSNHNDIAFVGDISQYDLRKRYESYCEQLEQRELTIRDDYIFTVKNTLLDGGRLAAEEFVKRQCPAKALLFGAGLTGIGFIQGLKQQDLSVDDFSFVCFDAIPLIPVTTPELAAVDQNIHLQAYRDINLLEQWLAGENGERHVLIEPKITQMKANSPDDFDPFMATCVELGEFYSPAYMKSVVINTHDWTREVGASNLDSIMALKTLFANFLAKGILSRLYIDNEKRQWIKALRIFETLKINNLSPHDASSLYEAKQYGSNNIEQKGEGARLTVHFCINVNERLWGFFSSFGFSQSGTQKSSFFSFTSYIDSALLIYEKNLELKRLKSLLDKAHNSGAEIHKEQQDNNKFDSANLIQWSANTRTYLWSNEALACLGLSSALDFNIYKNMELTDRIKDTEISGLREVISQASQENVYKVTSVHLRMKNGLYEGFSIKIEPHCQKSRLLSIYYYLQALNPHQEGH